MFLAAISIGVWQLVTCFTAWCELLVWWVEEATIFEVYKYILKQTSALVEINSFKRIPVNEWEKIKLFALFIRLIKYIPVF